MIIYDNQRNASVEIPSPGPTQGPRTQTAIKVGVSNGSRTEVIEGLNESSR